VFKRALLKGLECHAFFGDIRENSERNKTIKMHLAASIPGEDFLVQVT
jgi:hypothetical protein